MYVLGPGQEPRRGDLVLSAWNGPDDWAIRRGQEFRCFRERLRHPHGPDRRPFTWATHAAVVIADDGTLIEAAGRGISKGSLDPKAGEYTYANGLRMVAVVDPQLAAYQIDDGVAFLEQCLGEQYGRLLFLWLALTYATGWGLVVGIEGQEVCSGLDARYLEHCGQPLTRDGRFMGPMDLAELCGAPRSLARVLTA